MSTKSEVCFTSPPVNPNERIKLREKLAYGLGDAASNVVLAAVGGFITYFYTNVAGLAAATVGTILLISRLFDGISDIIMGILIDKTHSKYGKARPWLLWMAVPFAIASVLLFTVPNVGMVGKVIYAFVTYNLFSAVILTALILPYGVMNSLITTNQQDRLSLNIYRIFGSMACILGITIIVLPMVTFFGGDARAWQISFGILGLIGMILWLITFIGTKERVQAPATHAVKSSLKDSMKHLIHNKYWIILTVYSVLTQSMNGIQGINVYFSQYLLGDKELVGLLMTVNIIPVLVGMAIMSKVIARFGKRNCAMAGAVTCIFGSLLQAMAPTNLSMILLGTAIKGIGMAPLTGTIFAMLADVVDYNEWKTGLHNEGLVFSSASFGNKVGIGLGSALVGWALAIGKFNAQLPEQAASATNAIIAVYIYIPLVLFVLITILLSQYDLDKKYPVIIEELRTRRALHNK